MRHDLADPGRIRGYHAHVYYGPETRQLAKRLREALGSNFAVELGRWHDQPVGPHLNSMYQVAFPVAEFARLVPRLMLNRGSLDVLVHPQTGSDDDHTIYSLWLGSPLPLRLEVLRRTAAADGSAADRR